MKLYRCEITTAPGLSARAETSLGAASPEHAAAAAATRASLRGVPGRRYWIRVFDPPKDRPAGTLFAASPVWEGWHDGG